MNSEHLSVDISLPLDHFDLRARFTATSHVTGIFGPSGSGKTSLLQSIAGLQRRAKGRVQLGQGVWLDSANNIRVRPESREIGYVPQEGLLFPHLNVRQNLLAGAARARRAGAPLEETFRIVCDLLEINALLEREVGALSGGERQRVALGRAICSGPRLLLLDEPLASLDLPLRRKVLPFLRRVVDQFQIPMLLVSHDATEVQALCDELIVLSNGEVVTKGKPHTVLTAASVFPETFPDRFENILPCTVVSSNEKDTEVCVSPAKGLRLTIPRAMSVQGQKMWVGIPPRHIILCAREPEGLSVSNILPAHVLGVQTIGDTRLVTVSIAEDARNLAVEVTPAAFDDLGLANGRRVFLIINPASCVSYESDSQPNNHLTS